MKKAFIFAFWDVEKSKLFGCWTELFKHDEIFAQEKVERETLFDLV